MYIMVKVHATQRNHGKKMKPNQQFCKWEKREALRDRK